MIMFIGALLLVVWIYLLYLIIVVWKKKIKTFHDQMEPCVINQSTLVYLPPKMVHCPLAYKRMDRPIVFLYSMPQALVQEEVRKDLELRIPEADRANLFYPHQD